MLKSYESRIWIVKKGSCKLEPVSWDLMRCQDNCDQMIEKLLEVGDMMKMHIASESAEIFTYIRRTASGIKFIDKDVFQKSLEKGD